MNLFVKPERVESSRSFSEICSPRVAEVIAVPAAADFSTWRLKWEKISNSDSKFGIKSASEIVIEPLALDSVKLAGISQVIFV